MGGKQVLYRPQEMSDFEDPRPLLYEPELDTTYQSADISLNAVRRGGKQPQQLVGLGLDRSRSRSRPQSAGASSTSHSAGRNSNPHSDLDDDWSPASTYAHATNSNLADLQSRPSSSDGSTIWSPFDAAPSRPLSFAGSIPAWKNTPTTNPRLYTDDAPEQAQSYPEWKRTSFHEGHAESSHILPSSSTSKSISHLGVSSRLGPSLKARRSGDVALSVAPSPPMQNNSRFDSSDFSSALTSRVSPEYTPHRREVSLTSACMPATSSSSSFFASVRKRPSTDVLRSTPEFSNASDSKGKSSATSPQLQSGAWSNIAWKRRKRSPSQRRASPGDHHPQRTQTWNDLALSCACTCFGPFATFILPSPATPQSRSLSKAHHRDPKAKLTFLRVLLGLYIIYALVVFTAKLASLSSQLWSTPPDQTLPLQQAITSEYSAWQQARHKLLGAYNVAADALGSTALRIRRSSSKDIAGDFSADSESSNGEDNNLLLDRLPELKREWPDPSDRHSTATYPLSSFPQDYRFAKMFPTVDDHSRANIEPYVFHAETAGAGGDVTACLYYNDAWISQLPRFMERWQGPVSLVYETAHSRASTEANKVLEHLNDLRHSNELIRAHVDFHLVYNDSPTERQARDLRQRLILRPIGTNVHLNLARFFAKTDMTWLVSDARVLPSIGLRKQLNEHEEVRSYTMDYADGIIIPTFGFSRKYSPNATMLPLIGAVRETAGMNAEISGVGIEEFAGLAQAYVSAHYSSAPLALDNWPVEKADLLDLAASKPSITGHTEQSTESVAPILALYDRRWDAGKGPTNFAKWESQSYAAQEGPQLFVNTEMSETTRHSSSFYEVTDYDLKYAPSLVIGRERQPWCAERFEYNRAACVYQMYLQGAKKWVLPDGWAFTLESIENDAPKEPKNDAEKLKSAIASRLYTKFNSEACMHYGRAFLANNLWDSERAQHLRYSCAKVLSSYGIGLSEEEEAAIAKAEAAKKKKDKKKNKKKKK